MSLKTHDASTTLSELASKLPAASRVFQEHRLDFCCGGKRPLAEACAEQGLDPNAILEEIEDSARGRAGAVDLTGWRERPLAELVRHIVEHYHARLRRELPALRDLAARVEARHADHPRTPRGLAALLSSMNDDVLDHLAKEECILFPLIASGRGAEAGAPIHCMEAEHDDTARALGQIRQLTGDFTPPEDACTSWHALLIRLRAFEAEFMEHIHLENNVLFPAALVRT